MRQQAAEPEQSTQDLAEAFPFGVWMCQAVTSSTVPPTYASAQFPAVKDGGLGSLLADSWKTLPVALRVTATTW